MPSLSSALNTTDSFIADNLPERLGTASPTLINAVRDRFTAHRLTEGRLQAAFRTMRAPQDFAYGLLQTALNLHQPGKVDLAHAIWRQHWLSFGLLGGNVYPDHYTYQPALHHVLQNFPASAYYDERSGLIAGTSTDKRPSAPLLIGGDDLAKLCRQVDAGRQYQEHLDKVLDSAVQTLLLQEKQQRFALAVDMADLQGQLNAADLALLRLALDSSPLHHAEHPRISTRHLRMLGHALNGCVVFELHGGTPAASGHTGAQLILYLPHQPLQRFVSWAEMAAHLKALVSVPRSLDALLLHVALKDRVAFKALLSVRLSDPQPDLEVSGYALVQGLFEDLTRLQIQRIRDDARYLVVPVADFDAAEKWTRLHTVEMVGYDLLQLAGLFVPVLNELLLAQMVVQLLGEVYDGVSDWSRGHQHEALEHFLGVAETVAVGALTAAGTAAVVRGFKRSLFVDNLVPVASTPGRGRLWLEDLKPFQANRLPAEASLGSDGLYWQADRRWWRYQDHYHEVRHDNATGQWRLLRADGQPGFAPALHWNGECGWRLAWQRLQELEDTRTLLARIWPISPALAPERALEIIKVANIDQPALRRLVLEHRRLTPSLRDTLQRYTADTRINEFFLQLQQSTEVLDTPLMKLAEGQLTAEDLAPVQTRQAILDQAPALRVRLMDKLSSRQLQADDLASIVKNVFPGLPDAYALDLVEQSSAAQRLRIREEGVLPLAVAERARAALIDARITRMRQALHLNNAYHEELPALVFALLRTDLAWPREVNIDVCQGAPNGRLIARLYPDSAVSPSRVMVWKDGQMDVYDKGVRLFPGSSVQGGLLDRLWYFLPEADRLRLGWTGVDAVSTMRASLLQRVPGDRKAIMALLGIRAPKPRLQPGKRLPDGRYGYLLSGRGAGNLHAERTLQDRVRALYPGFTARQLETYLALLDEQPGSAFTVLLEEEQRFHELDQALHRWSEAAVQSEHRASRRLVADELRRGWRLQGLEGRPHADGQRGMALVLGGSHATDLPELPADADFRHVSEMSLTGMRLENIPSEFFRPFSHVSSINLDDNALLAVPEGLTQLTRLRELTLSRNSLQLTAADLTVIGTLRQLRVLDLSENTLNSFTVALDHLPRLRELGLRNTGLSVFPPNLTLGVSLEYVDLRYNLITRLPETLRNTRLSLRRGLALRGNPLPADYSMRWLGIESASESESSIDQEAPARTQWLLRLAAPQRTLRSAQWDRLSDEPTSNDFFQLLHELTGTSDFRLARQDLEARVWSMFDSLEDDPALREEVFSLASQPRSCSDSVISSFSLLEIRVLSADAARVAPENTQARLLDLARRLFRLEQVESYAREDIARRRSEQRGVDEIEVSLVYRIRLAAELDLPGQPQSMQFERVGGVTSANLAAALTAVREAEASEALETYISQRDFWLQHLRREHATAFEVIEAPFWTRMESLDAQREGLDDGLYLAQVNQVAADREAAVNAHALLLTRQALGRDPGTS